MFYGMVSLPGQQSASPSPSTPFPNSQKSPVCSFSKTSLYFLLIPPRFFAACLKHAAIFKDFFLHPKTSPEQLDFPGISFSMD